jgi:hypothetical protein
MPQLAATIWADGPASAPNEPFKPDIRDWGTWIEGIIAAFLGNGGLIYTSRALLYADLTQPANSSAWVYGDATVAYNGVYRKIGAANTGSWSRVADLPYSFIIANDAGAGTPNAIQATTSISVSASALIWMNIADTNTASPVTVQFNGGPVYTVKTNSGNDPAAGGLPGGTIVLGIVSGATFRLLSDQASTAILAAAEAAQAAAEEARDVAVAAAATTDPLETHEFSVVLAQTSVTISGGYTVGKVATVHLNGVEIDGWTASTGTTVTFPAITANDIADGESSATMKVRIGTSVIGLAGLDGRYLRTTSVETLTEERQEFVVESLGLDAKYHRITSMTHIPLDALGLLPGNTAAQNKEAFQDGLDIVASKAKGGGLELPAGSYNIDGGLTFTASGKALDILGIKGGSTLNVKSGARLLTVDVDEGYFRFKGMTMLADGVSSGFLAMLYVQAYGFGGFVAEDLNIRRDGVMPGFVGIDMGRVRQSNINNCEIQVGQDLDYSTDGIGIRATPEEGEGTIHNITKVSVRNTGIGMKFSMGSTALGAGNLEGIIVDQCNCVGVDEGIVAEAISSTYRPPLFVVSKTHINALRYGVFAVGISDADIHNNYIYLDNSGVPVAAIYLGNTIQSNVSFNRIYAIRQLIASPPTLANFPAIAFGDDTDIVDVCANYYSGTGTDAMIWAQLGSSRIAAHGNRYKRSAGSNGWQLDQGPSAITDLGGNTQF